MIPCLGRSVGEPEQYLALTKLGPGCIINVSSVLAQKGKRGVAVYAASKAGLVGKWFLFMFFLFIHCVSAPSIARAFECGI